MSLVLIAVNLVNKAVLSKWLNLHEPLVHQLSTLLTSCQNYGTFPSMFFISVFFMFILLKSWPSDQLTPYLSCSRWKKVYFCYTGLFWNSQHPSFSYFFHNHMKMEQCVNTLIVWGAMLIFFQLGKFSKSIYYLKDVSSWSFDAVINTIDVFRISISIAKHWVYR